MRRLLTLSLLLTLVPTTVSAAAHPPLEPPPVATFSIVAIDPDNGDLGVAVASRYFSVGSVVPWALAGVGAVATQANVNVGYGPQAIDLLRQGLSAQQVLDKIRADDTFPGKDGRQVAIVDAKGNVAAYTGPNAPNWAGDRQGKTWSAQGNILVGPQVPEAMGRAFEATQGELAERLYAALKAGDDAGGDSRGHQSASILVVRKGGGRNTNNDRYVYINVDDNPQPFAELRRLLDLNLSYLYEDAAERRFDKGDKKGALEAARKAARYAPDHADTHLVLGLFEYVNGNKEAALAELRKAQAGDKGFDRQLDAILSSTPELKGLADDKDFLAKLKTPGSAASAPSAVSASERERELIFRGLQYVEAIRVFQIRFARLPHHLGELIEVQPRCIRQLWKDPMTADGEWTVVLADPQHPELGVRGVRSASSGTSTLPLFGSRRYADWEFSLPAEPRAQAELFSLSAKAQGTADSGSPEAELRAALRELRGAIDEYKRASDRGLIPVDLGTDGYPKTLGSLADGVELVGGKGQKMTFLHRIPMDPITGKADWELRSYQNRPGAASWGGEDVFDVHSRSTAIGSDGKPYSEW